MYWWLQKDNPKYLQEITILLKINSSAFSKALKIESKEDVEFIQAYINDMINSSQYAFYEHDIKDYKVEIRLNKLEEVQPKLVEEFLLELHETDRNGKNEEGLSRLFSKSHFFHSYCLAWDEFDSYLRKNEFNLNIKGRNDFDENGTILVEYSYFKNSSRIDFRCLEIESAHYTTSRIEVLQNNKQIGTFNRYDLMDKSVIQKIKNLIKAGGKL